jgi:glycosyltransferase involved in cell wall biosynthesis
MLFFQSVSPTGSPLDERRADDMERKTMLVLCPFPQGVAAGQRLKYEQYFDRWRRQGWQIEVSPYMDPAIWQIVYQQGNTAAKIKGVLQGHMRRLRDLLRVRRYDLIYIFMYVTPFFSSTMERAVRGLAKRVIYDVEDNILVDQTLPKQLNPNPIVRFIKGSGKARFLIRTADHVITSSPFLNDRCLTLNLAGACTYITSSVDTDRFRPRSSCANSRSVIIGWTGTYSSKVFLDQLRVVFARLTERVPFKLRIISNFNYELPGVNLDVVRWNAETEVRDLQELDIGVYPLPMNDWVLGKSGLKAIQYMAFGLPCVATEVGTTPLLIRDRVNGRLVKTDDEWVDALEELVRDADLRHRLGEQARRDALARYSLHAVGEKYDEVLRSVMES